jgi:sterol desaturase/sphingolipid hydroxylase (fatty acid hydroxylase superfamily)
MAGRNPIGHWATGAIAGAAFVLLVWGERRRPLRRETQPKLERNVRNLAIAGLASAVVQLTELPAARALTQEPRGLVQWLRLPEPWAAIAAVLLLDYTLYLWHVAAHKAPWLWRFHRPHHADLDMDASTALRFHFGEMALSVPFRAAQILLIGVSAGAFAIWQTLLVVSILFHHSSVRLPLEWERRLNRVLVTPRMHGIHHSTRPDELNSNWSSGLSIWDRLHGTFRDDVPQETITIGMPELRAPEQVTLARTLALPFRGSHG